MAGRCSLQLLGSDGRQARLSGEREAPKTHVQGKGTSHVQGEGDRETTLPSECHFTTTPVSLERTGGGGGGSGDVFGPTPRSGRAVQRGNESVRWFARYEHRSRDVKDLVGEDWSGHTSWLRRRSCILCFAIKCCSKVYTMVQISRHNTLKTFILAATNVIYSFNVSNSKCLRRHQGDETMRFCRLYKIFFFRFFLKRLWM